MMAKKVFKYKGKKLEELKELRLTELANLFPSNQRRKLIRLTDEEKKLMEKIKDSKKPVKTHNRTMLVLPFMVGKTIMIYNGKEFQNVTITHEMIGHRLGEFSPTRGKVNHGSAGIGATKSSRAQKK